MFGSKPTFGTSTTNTGFGGFNTSTTASPFGQSAFGKPATTAFGANPSFGVQPATTSLFGTTTAQPQTQNLFGGASTSTAFGSTPVAQPGFGFQQPQQNASLFGTTQQPGQAPSLFGQPTASGFGTGVKPGGLGGFGQTPNQTNTSLFGQTAASTNTGFGSFGQPSTAGTNVFGGVTSAFGQPQTAAGGANPGTSIAKYQPTIGQDTLMKAGQANNVNTKQHCITAMKEYESKSLEELRAEDYLSNRKGPQAGTSGTSGFFGTNTQQTAPGSGLFGTTTQQTAGLFGQTAGTGNENKSLFGSSAFGQPATSAFGANPQQNSFLAKPFGAPTNTGFGANPTDASSNVFGAKPAFGQTAAPSLFGQNPTANTAPSFGQQTTGFGAFGTNAQQQQPSLFGNTGTDANKPAFGLGAQSTANTGFGGFGAPATSTASGGLFGTKPATGFGATPAFGATSTANAGFTNFSLNNQGGGLFNSSLNKPATSGFGGFGTQTSNAPLNFNTGTGNASIFGNTAAKPGGMFGSSIGTGQPTAGGIFSGGTGGFGTNNTMGSFGTSTLGGVVNANLSGFGNTSQQQIVPIHQQILSKVTSPFGDNPIFKDLKRTDETDASRATNPIAQKAILEKNANQFKVTTKPSPSSVKIKPVGNALTKKSLFKGLEEFDSSSESFILKPNVKRLVLQQKKETNIPAALNTSGSISGHSSPSRQLNISSTHSESFSVETHIEQNVIQSGDNDASRRESWLHPNNLEKVRQLNLNSSLENGSPLNSTLSELVPRRPLDTFRGSVAISGRPSVSTVIENPFEDQTFILSRRDTIVEQQSDSALSIGSTERSILADNTEEFEEHPTGITLRRVGYYTIPSLDELKSYLAEDGTCIVPNFTVGREGYGNIYFAKEMDVAGLNLDEIVHFRNKEVIVYPDDENKPPLGQGLNREAQVTLDKVWPIDKTVHEPIKDPERLTKMDWEGRLRRACNKNDSRFVEYRPETGSWVFRVKHFSKYTLDDSDEETCIPTDPKKAKINEVNANMIVPKQPESNAAGVERISLAALKNAQKISEDCARALNPKNLAGSNNQLYPMEETADCMQMDKTQFFQSPGYEYSMFDHAQSLGNAVTSPTVALAKSAGQDAHKLQLMKASFFMDDEDNKSNTSDLAIAPHQETSRNDLYGFRQNEFYQSSQSLRQDEGFSEASSHMELGLPISSLHGGSSSASVMSILRALPSETPSTAAESASTVTLITAPPSKLPPLIVKPKVGLKKTFVNRVPLCLSISNKLLDVWVADLGMYRSHSFKVGFGPKSTIIIPSTQANLKNNIINENMHRAGPAIFKIRGKNDFSSDVLQHIQIRATQHYKHFKESIVDHLKIQLAHSEKITIEGSECPFIKPGGGQKIIGKHLEKAIKSINFGTSEEYAVSVWSLCLALWGDHEEMEACEPNSHYAIMCRRNLFSEWLENTLTNNDLLKQNITKQSYLDYMLELIMCHKVTEACELAFKHDDANLALLLSQLSSGPLVRQLMEDQLAAWHMDEADKFIQLERLKLFMLVAGVSLMNSAHGPVNTLEGIEWLKVLAIQVWYLSSPTASITDSVLAYEKAFKSEEFYALPPTPPYVKNANKSRKQTVFDLRYHLLQLFSKRTYPLEGLLNPTTHTADLMDYRLSWLIMQTLESLGYNHCARFSECQLHTNFATQLENNDLWEWAIFVLLHIKDANQREIAVQNLLYRFVDVSENVPLNESEKFVIEELGVPEKWIDYAKAVKAGALKHYELQTNYLLRAKQWALAHEVIFQHIAPDAIINGKTAYLTGLLEQFVNADLNTSVRVPNWANQGQLFLDYIENCEKFQQLKSLNSEADIETRWEHLKPQLAELCSRINLLPCPTTKHRLLKSEIAQHLVNLVRGVILVCPIINPCLVTKIALERLPVPQEFANQELRFLLDIAAGDLKHGRPIKNLTEAATIMESTLIES